MTRVDNRPPRIAAVVSDVDGTLVTDEKVLTDRTKSAVAALRKHGIAFSIISSRPPRGLRMLLDALGVTLPFGAFNGGVIAAPDLSVMTEHLLPPQIARRVVEMLALNGAQSWVFAGQAWLVRHPSAPYVALEEKTVEFSPTVVDDLAPYLGHAGKIVGVSADFDRLAECERDMRAAFAGRASVARSQPQYLDVTHPLADKGVALRTLSRLLAIQMADIAVIGDGDNDVAMFEQAGISIAMGNASAGVQAAADVVTDSNRDDGFASAVERFILAGRCANAASEVHAGGHG
jgi:Cof subfamily protein (haloacid dehalogenase superfamily)